MSSGDRLRADFGAALEGCEPGLATADRLCLACVELLDVDGAAISLTYAGSSRGTFGSSGELGRTLDEFQFTFGEGPCLDSVAGARQVTVRDFRDPFELRWPAYAEAVRGTEVRSVHAFPVTVNAVCVGALDLFRVTPGQLLGTALTGALLAAQLAALPLLDLMCADVDWVSIAGGSAWPQLESLERVEIYQATGMLMGRLDVGPAEALVRLRAYAFAHSMTASQVAWDILERRLLLERDGRPAMDDDTRKAG